MIHVFAIVTATPGQRAALLDAFKANMPSVHAEDGCIEYQAVIDTPEAGRMQAPIGPDSFAVIEKWASLDALKAHAASPHMAAYGAQTKPLIASRVIHILSPA
jgi:quinol monooxygenase YgiN